MKKETIEKIEDEITKKTTMPDNLKGKVRKEIFINILLAIGIVVYFIFIVLGSLDTTKAVRSIDLKIFSLILLSISIILFEVAYKKDSGKLAINGIEVLIVAIITLFLPYIVFELDSKHQKYYILSSAIIAIYYIIKAIVIMNKAKSLYKKQESDIKEITKNESKKIDILDEEIDEKDDNAVSDIHIDEKAKVTKTNKKVKKEIAKKNVMDDTEEKTNKTKKQTKTSITENSKTDNKDKKRGRPRKINIDETPKESKTKKQNKINATNTDLNEIENKPKKRGRPRKINIDETTKENKTKKQDKVNAVNTDLNEIENKPKKRGRPRKVVSK